MGKPVSGALAFLWVFSLVTVLIGSWVGMDSGDLVAVGMIGLSALVVACLGEGRRV